MEREVACPCGLANPGPEHRANFPILCTDKPAAVADGQRASDPTKLTMALRDAPACADLLERIANEGGQLSQLAAEQSARVIRRLHAALAASDPTSTPERDREWESYIADAHTAAKDERTDGRPETTPAF